MSEIKTYYYNKQLRRYIVQFMAIFADLEVEVGKLNEKDPRTIKVPIIYGSKDRVVAAIKGENTQNKPLRLPTMSAYLRGIEMAPELRKAIGVQRRQTFLKTGGIFPDDIEVVHQLMPVPYNTTFELSIWASNTDQHHQIIEQILMLFDPILQIQTSDEIFDWTKITTLELMNISYEENYPPGVDRRSIQSTLTFNCPIWIASPSNLKKNYIAKILLRLGIVDPGINLNNSEQVVDNLEENGFNYETIISLDDIDIDATANANPNP